MAIRAFCSEWALAFRLVEGQDLGVGSDSTGLTGVEEEAASLGFSCECGEMGSGVSGGQPGFDFPEGNLGLRRGSVVADLMSVLDDTDEIALGSEQSFATSVSGGRCCAFRAEFECVERHGEDGERAHVDQSSGVL
jgi:hypothetical protein